MLVELSHTLYHPHNEKSLVNTVRKGTVTRDFLCLSNAITLVKRNENLLLFRAGMPESARSSHRIRKLLDELKLDLRHELKHHLRDAFISFDRERLLVRD